MVPLRLMALLQSLVGLRNFLPKQQKDSWALLTTPLHHKIVDLERVETPPDFDLRVTSSIFFFLDEQITDLNFFL